MVVPKNPPAFQVYPAELLADTASMTRAEAASYVFALCHCWRFGSLPAEPTRLARVLRTSEADLAAEWAALEPMFERRDDTWIHPRIEQHRQERAEFAAKLSAAGKRGRAAQAQPGHGQAQARPEPGPASSGPALQSSVCSLQSADCREDSASLRSAAPLAAATPPSGRARLLDVVDDPDEGPPLPAVDRQEPAKSGRKRAAKARGAKNRSEIGGDDPNAATGLPARAAGSVERGRPIQTILWEEYEAMYLDRHGQRPTPQGHWFVQLATLVRKHNGPEEIRSRLKVYFDNPPFRLRDGARDLGRFLRSFDMLAPNGSAPAGPAPSSASAASQLLAEEARRILGESASYLGVHAPESSREPWQRPNSSAEHDSAEHLVVLDVKAIEPQSPPPVADNPTP